MEAMLRSVSFKSTLSVVAVWFESGSAADIKARSITNITIDMNMYQFVNPDNTDFLTH